MTPPLRAYVHNTGIDRLVSSTQNEHGDVCPSIIVDMIQYVNND